MLEGFLFDINEESLDTVLRRNAESGILFYSISQCRKHLGLSESQVRYAIDTYRLDALFLAGEYRVPYTAILRFADSDWLEASIEYLNAHRITDIEGVYDLNFNGEIGHVVRSLQNQHIPLEAIPLLLSKDKKEEYDDLPGEERNKVDWYYLDELNLPLKALSADYARLLGIRDDWLCWKLGERLERRVRNIDVIEYPELLDLLVDCEMVNFPIPIELDFRKPPVEAHEEHQIYLF